VALQIVQRALECGALVAPGGLITEGTAGSTGISLAMVSRGTAWAEEIADWMPS
jgi:cysteine synthase